MSAAEGPRASRRSGRITLRSCTSHSSCSSPAERTQGHAEADREWLRAIGVKMRCTDCAWNYNRSRSSKMSSQHISSLSSTPPFHATVHPRFIALTSCIMLTTLLHHYIYPHFIHVFFSFLFSAHLSPLLSLFSFYSFILILFLYSHLFLHFYLHCCAGMAHLTATSWTTERVCPYSLRRGAAHRRWTRARARIEGVGKGRDAES